MLLFVHKKSPASYWRGGLFLLWLKRRGGVFRAALAEDDELGVALETLPNRIQAETHVLHPASPQNSFPLKAIAAG
jgi:hypothetical protein